MKSSQCIGQPLGTGPDVLHGHPDEFRDENFRRVLVNTILWTAHRDVEKLKK